MRTTDQAIGERRGHCSLRCACRRSCIRRLSTRRVRRATYIHCRTAGLLLICSYRIVLQHDFKVIVPLVPSSSIII